MKSIAKKLIKESDKIFFYAFLITLPLSIRKVLYFYPIKGEFNEYTGIYLYLSDTLLIISILLWILILYNNYILLSINTLLPTPTKRSTWFIKYLSIITKCSTWNIFIKKGVKKTYSHITNNNVDLFIILLLTLSLLSTAWAENKILSIFKTIKLAEFYLLYLYIKLNIRKHSHKLFHVEQFTNPSFSINILKVFILLGSINAFLGITQFIKQKSLDFFWLKESLLSTSIPGVAEITINGNNYIRSYGLFPHPNILGGFLIISIFSTYLYMKLFHVEQSWIAKNNVNCSTWNNKRCESYSVNIANVPRGTFIENTKRHGRSLILVSLLAIQVLSLFLTFSKTALLSLFIIIILINKNRFIVPRGTIRKNFKINIYRNNLFEINYKKILKYSIFIVFLGFSSILISNKDVASNINKSLKERSFYLNVSRGTISENPFLGIGAGNSVYSMKEIKNIAKWEFQPVHNVFLLIWSEIGIIGFILFLLILGSSIINKKHPPTTNCSTWNNGRCESYSPNTINVPRGTFHDLRKKEIKEIKKYFKYILIGIVLIMIFDHYHWDIQQGGLMLWLVLSML